MQRPNPYQMARELPAHLLDQWQTFLRRRRKRARQAAEQQDRSL